MNTPPAQWEEPEFNSEEDLSIRTRWRRIAKNLPAGPSGIFKSFLTGGWQELKEESRTFLLSKTELSVGPHEAAHWEPSRLLGEGSFGRCGLWIKLDSQRTLLDEVAVKELKIYLQSREFRNHIQYEAIIQRDLQRQERDLLAEEAQRPDQYHDYPPAWKHRHIPHLRQYKYNPKLKTCRFYMEYCKHENLEILQKRYVAWCAWFPESVLWHILISLTRACRLMAKSPHRTSPLHELNRSGDESEDPDPSRVDQRFVLHLDIKTENIMLGDSGSQLSAITDDSAKTDLQDFPAVYLADWGLAEYSTATHPDNPGSLRNPGTQGWRGPEQSIADETLKLFQDYDEKPVTAADKITSALNVFNIAKVVFDLMNQYHTHEDTDKVDHMMRDLEESDYKKNGDHFLPQDYSTGKQPEYSPALRQLLRRCLNPCPSKRPTEIALENLAVARLKSYLEAGGDTGDDSGESGLERLYFKNNEINDMPFGTGNWQVDALLVQYLFETENPDYPLDTLRWGWKRPRHSGQIVKSARTGSDGNVIIENFSDVETDTSEEGSDDGGDDADADDDNEDNDEDSRNLLPGRGMGKTWPEESSLPRGGDTGLSGKAGGQNAEEDRVSDNLGGTQPQRKKRKTRHHQSTSESQVRGRHKDEDEKDHVSAQDSSDDDDDSPRKPPAGRGKGIPRPQGLSPTAEHCQKPDEGKEPSRAGSDDLGPPSARTRNKNRRHIAAVPGAGAAKHKGQEGQEHEAGEGDQKSVEEDQAQQKVTRRVPSDETYNKMTIAEMRTELQKRGWPLPRGTRINKPHYLQALKDADAAKKYGDGAVGKRVPRVADSEEEEEEDDDDSQRSSKRRKE